MARMLRSSATIGSGVSQNFPNSAFRFRNEAGQNNISLDATTVLKCSVQDFNEGNDYNSGTYTYTAPIDGFYHFCFSLRLDTLDAADEYIEPHIIFSGTTDIRQMFDANKVLNADSDTGFNMPTISVIVEMDSGDTAIPKVYIAATGSSAAQTDVNVQTQFSGALLGTKGFNPDP